MSTLALEGFEDRQMTPAARRGRRILVIEDDQCLETILSRVMHEIDPDATLDWATSGEEALSHLMDEADGTGYDLVISDIFLEGPVSGLAVWDLCRERYPRTPVMLMSGLAVDKFLTAIGRDTICPPFLPKPFSVGECRQMVEGLLVYRDKALAH